MVYATSPVEIILDSGADVSALSRTYGNVGVEVGQHESQFIDAQGSSLHVQSTRMAKVIFGDVVIKERFIVTDVSISILVLGHLVRLDVFSDGIEVKRLRGINVLMDLDANSNVDMKSLSTRFVRTWRDKVKFLNNVEYG